MGTEKLLPKKLYVQQMKSDPNRTQQFLEKFPPINLKRFLVEKKLLNTSIIT